MAPLLFLSEPGLFVVQGCHLNIPRLFGIISERRANLVDAEIDAALEVYEGVVTPEAKLDFFPRHDLSCML